MNDLVTPTPESEAFNAAFTGSRQYKELADAPNLAAGTIEVWYMKPDFFSEGIRGARPNHDPTNIHWTHTLLGSIRSAATAPQTMSPELLDELWIALQGENWSPFGEARHLIRSKGLRHTSMSVGDCFKLPNGEVWIVGDEGFKRVDE